MKKIVSILAVAAAAGSALAQGGTSLAGATNWAGPQTVTGAYTAAQFNETLIRSWDPIVVTPGTDAAFADTVGGLTAGASFRAETRATPGGPASYDTRLRVQNSSLTTLGENDDFTGLFSRVTGTVPADGILRLDAAHWQNTSYSDATASPAGSYGMDLFSVTMTAPGVSTQWYRFTGLGGLLEAETSNLVGFTDTTMAAFDSAGNLLISDDDDGAGFASLISASDNIAVPGDGIIYIAVTVYHGLTGQTTNAYYDNNTASATAGTFDLRVVPSPGALALLGLGGLVTARRRR